VSSPTSGDDDAITVPLPTLTAVPEFDGHDAEPIDPRGPVAASDALDHEPRPASLPSDSHTHFENSYAPSGTNRAEDPFTPKRRRRGLADAVGGKVATAGAGVIALIIAASLVLHFAGGSDHRDTADTTASTAESAPRPADQARLANTLSPAFSAAMNCQPGETNPAGTLASVHCTPRDQRAGAPAEATYRLAGQKDNLDALLKAALHETTLQLCPGNLLSPGPWHLTTNPNTPSGILFCGTRTDTAVVGWTDTDKLTIAEIHSAPMPSLTLAGPALADLYQWWQMNSYRH
jgi:serine/threonine-protein kinase